MGYSTYFTGEVKITPEPKASQIAFINAMIDEGECNAGHMDFEWTKDMSGLKHNGGEKSYAQDEVMQEVINDCIAKFPDMKFNGTMQARGEDYEDRWLLIVKDNVVVNKKEIMTGEKVTCPHCDEEFRLNEK